MLINSNTSITIATKIINNYFLMTRVYYHKFNYYKQENNFIVEAHDDNRDGQFTRESHCKLKEMLSSRCSSQSVKTIFFVLYKCVMMSSEKFMNYIFFVDDKRCVMLLYFSFIILFLFKHINDELDLVLCSLINLICWINILCVNLRIFLMHFEESEFIIFKI